MHLPPFEMPCKYLADVTQNPKTLNKRARNVIEVKWITSDG